MQNLNTYTPKYFGVILVKVDGKLDSSHRSQIDIIADILDTAVDGARKTHIMYRCNLSFKQLETYLGLLLDRGLLRTVSGEEKTSYTMFFVITDRGQALLDAYQSLRVLLAA